VELAAGAVELGVAVAAQGAIGGWLSVCGRVENRRSLRQRGLGDETGGEKM
jgi:hypothetical protein